MRQIPLDLSIAIDWTPLPSKNYLQAVQQKVSKILTAKQDVANEPEFFLPEADMLWEMNDECALLG